MTNDELNKLIVDQQRLNDKTNKFIIEFVNDLEKLILIIKMQKESLDFYAKSLHYIYFPPVKDDMYTPRHEVESGIKARDAISAVNEKLKEMGIEI